MKGNEHVQDLGWLLVSKEKLTALLKEVTSHDISYKIKPETMLLLECLFEGENCYLVIENDGNCHLIHEPISELKERAQVQSLLTNKRVVAYCAHAIGGSNRSLPIITNNVVMGQFKTMHDGMSAWINLKPSSKVVSCRLVANQSTSLIIINQDLKFIIPVQVRYVEERIVYNLSIYSYYLQLMMSLFYDDDVLYNKFQEQLFILNRQFLHRFRMSNIAFIKMDCRAFKEQMLCEFVADMICKRNKDVQRKEIFELLGMYLVL
ncbi:hypothetical protein [Vagococcus xieshaowenii]|uniref:Uncharacterized protein n=1 Tax=Vagococcus xieshaowenii TaxID=2562451 RepID=A0AAJ5EH99_9ENTE|nr:hypothetical protein [Vagococcus xieshaowenii]QCA29245.1 hypothetical protein E4Z98_07905 [Vagococcus xieshaowenii]TFZ43243.1 hypothetical protein E4031_00540 [Vagococcus xieshaowenii]